MDTKPIQCTGFNQLVNARYGVMLYNTNDTYVGRSFELYGEFSEGEVGLFRQFLHPGDTVLDIGANIGAHTVVFSRLVGPSGIIHAFEPQRLVFHTLCANVALNSLTNVHCHHAAVAEKVGQIIVPRPDYQKENNFGGLGLGHHDVGDSVRTIPLDDLDLRACRFIKIDVEGMEKTVLKGGETMIRKFRPILYVENDRLANSDDLLQQIENLEYKMYWHLPRLYNEQNFFGNPKNVFGMVRSFNLVCIPPGEPVNVQGFEQVHVGDLHVLDRWRNEQESTNR
jgi:FkbM family methyltransferase